MYLLLQPEAFKRGFLSAKSSSAKPQPPSFHLLMRNPCLPFLKIIDRIYIERETDPPPKKYFASDGCPSLVPPRQRDIFIIARSMRSPPIDKLSFNS